jgi:hypothetical protein
MARYSGRDLVVQWIHAGGTTNLSADFRSLTVGEEVDDIDASAGDDTYKEHIAGMADATAELEFVDQSGTAVGSVQWVAIAPRTSGTLEWNPEGTAAGEQKHTAPAYVQARNREMPYDDVTMVSATFQLTASPTMSAN